MTSDDKEPLGRLFPAPGDWPVTAPEAVLVVVAHPDDETVGAGGHLALLRPLALVHVTDGAPMDPGDATAAGCPDRSAYAAVRRRELLDACEVAGLNTAGLRCLGVVDQEAAFHLQRLTWSIEYLLREMEPDVVLTHAYEGGHPDHDATALAVHAACLEMRRSGLAAPAIVEMTSYHHRAGRMAVGEFLPSEAYPSQTRVLSEAQRELKRAMIRCYRTQQRTLEAFPIEVERFRMAPKYDFRRPPHPGVLFYEMFPWGMNRDQWTRLAGELLDTLEIRECL